MIGTTLGGFAILREIGRGGMGIVYEAQQSNPSRLIALKVLPPELAHNPGVAERFKREANRMAGLGDHPGIATVYAAGEEGGQAFLAMQLLPGGDLESRLAREGRIAPQEAARIIATIAEALDYAHKHGLIHRDIKPANIMFDAGGRPVLTDFGIATAADEMRMTQTGMSVCTPEYASPEQLKGNPVDGRSDIYSLGIVLYRMVCGCHPFQANTPMAVAVKHLSETPPLPRELCPDIPPPLEQIIWSCIAREPSERYGTAGHLAAALQAFVSGHAAPAVTRMVTSTQTTQGRSPGPSLLTVFAITLAVVLGIGLIVTAVIILRPGRENPLTRYATVPSIIGMTESTGRTILGNVQLALEMGPSIYSASYAPGCICSQAPDAGAQVTRDTVVRVTLSMGPDPTELIRNLQERWRTTWVGHDLDAHLSCFWPDANIDGMSRTRYRAYQAREFVRQPTMEVTTPDLVVSVNGDTATSTFTQDFHGWGPNSEYQSKGHVTHTSRQRNGEWRIIREDFTKVSSHGH